MYGLVNKAVEELVRSRFGEATWLRIKAEAGVEDEVFIGNQSYPDETTYALVGSASRVLGVESSVVLELFGQHWVLKTARESYGAMLKAHGGGFVEFLRNLPNFHSRVVLIYPKLQPPEFRVTDETETSLRLHYYSQRAGLAPFVVGLVKGLATHFGTEAAVTLESRREDGFDHDTFLVSWTPVLAA